MKAGRQESWEVEFGSIKAVDKKMKKYAYFTLVARDKYVDGTICMFKSLRDKTQYPLIALTMDISDTSRKRLIDLGIQCRDVEKIESVKAGIGDNISRA